MVLGAVPYQTSLGLVAFSLPLNDFYSRDNCIFSYMNIHLNVVGGAVSNPTNQAQLAQSQRFN